MCTVTVVPYFRDGNSCVRVGCNRDELRDRPAAELPRVRCFAATRSIYPLDPVSGGTWIAVNEVGLAFVLLNVNDGSVRQQYCPLRSRGAIIPTLLNCLTLMSALGRLSSMEPSDYSPFRLLLIDRFAIAELHSDGKKTRLLQSRRLVRPLLFTSSGLGDALVEFPRRQLFLGLFERNQDVRAQQERFHRHRWPDRRHLSVCMSRPEARTVSYSVADLTPDGVTFIYQPLGPNQPEDSVQLSLLPLAEGVA